MSTLKFTSAVSVDKGLIRSNNEDNFYFNGAWLTADIRDNSDTFSSSSSDGIRIYGVFDGMGGEELGEEASLIAAQAMSKAHNRLRTGNCDAKTEILSAVEDANERICRKITENGGKRIGATFSAVIIENGIATVFNIGDSRVYLLRAGKMEQISVDDTAAQRLVSMGVLTPEEAKKHKDRNKLTQHLGIFKEEMIIEPHISNTIDVQNGDKFLLCSDGLTDMLTDEEISVILLQDKPCEQISKELVDTALKNGGKDNVTAIVVRADEEKKKTAFTLKKLIVSVISVLLAVLIGIGAFFLINTINNTKTDTTEHTNINVEKGSANLWI